MPLTPGNSEDPLGAEPARGESTTPPPAGYRAAPPPRRLRWSYRAVWVVLFAVLSFEIGLFLAVFPWMDYWTLNHLSGYVPALDDYWDDPFFKGAVTGLGCVNLYIAAAQIISLIRRRNPS